MISFNVIVLLGLISRIVISGIGVLRSLQILGFKDIDFLKGFARTHFFNIATLSYWLIALFSIAYFEAMIYDLDQVSMAEAFSEHAILSSIVMILLFLVNAYAVYDSRATILGVIEAKKEIQTARITKNVFKVFHAASWFVPGGLIIKGGLFTLTLWGHSKVNKRVESTVEEKIKNVIGTVLLIALVNLSIILMAVYVIK